MRLGRRFRLTVDSEVVGYFRSDLAAREAVPEDFATGYYVHEKIGGRWFVGSFGYNCGTTSTADLAASGVPIAAECINTDPR